MKVGKDTAVDATTIDFFYVSSLQFVLTRTQLKSIGVIRLLPLFVDLLAHVPGTGDQRRTPGRPRWRCRCRGGGRRRRRRRRRRRSTSPDPMAAVSSWPRQMSVDRWRRKKPPAGVGKMHWRKKKKNSARFSFLANEKKTKRRRATKRACARALHCIRHEESVQNRVFNMRQNFLQGGGTLRSSPALKQQLLWTSRWSRQWSFSGAGDVQGVQELLCLGLEWTWT